MLPSLSFPSSSSLSFLSLSLPLRMYAGMGARSAAEEGGGRSDDRRSAAARQRIVYGTWNILICFASIAGSVGSLQLHAHTRVIITHSQARMEGHKLKKSSTGADRHKPARGGPGQSRTPARPVVAPPPAAPVQARHGSVNSSRPPYPSSCMRPTQQTTMKPPHHHPPPPPPCRERRRCH